MDIKKHDSIKIENAEQYKVHATSERAIMVKVYSNNDYTSDSRSNLWIPLSQLNYSHYEVKTDDTSQKLTNENSYILHYVSLPTWLLKKEIN